MLIVDESRWPLAVVRWQAPVCGCDFECYRSRFESWLSRGEWFAFVSVTGEPLSIPACLLRQMGQWLQQRRGLIAQRCAGFAGVFPERLLPESCCRAYDATISTQLGCAAAAFASEAAAVTWALGRLKSPLTVGGDTLPPCAGATVALH